MVINDVATVAVIEHDITDHFLAVLQLQCKAHQKHNFQLLIRETRPQQFDIFVENLETHLHSKNNDRIQKS